MPTDGKFLLLFLKREEEEEDDKLSTLPPRLKKADRHANVYSSSSSFFFIKVYFSPIQTVCWTFSEALTRLVCNLFFQVLEFVRVVILVRVSRWQKWQRSGTIKEQPEHVRVERVEELPIDHLYVDVGYHLMLLTRLDSTLYSHLAQQFLLLFLLDHFNSGTYVR